MITDTGSQASMIKAQVLKSVKPIRTIAAAMDGGKTKRY